MVIEIEPLQAYEAKRMDVLRAMAKHKAARRMAIQDDISLLWESRDSIQFQAQEMARMEGDDPESLKEILAGYEDILPNARRLNATLYVEVVESGRIKTRLGYYAGLEHSIRLHVGEVGIPARIVGDHGTEDATTAVTYLAFDVPEGANLEGARVLVDHPRFKVDLPLPEHVQAHPY